MMDYKMIKLGIGGFIAMAMMLLLCLTSCDREQEIIAHEKEPLVGYHWRVDSMIDLEADSVIENTTDRNIVVEFGTDSSISADHGGTKLVGKYEIQPGNQMSIIDMHRGDFGGWPTPDYVKAFLRLINRADEYELEEYYLRIFTDQNEKIVFYRM